MSPGPGANIGWKGYKSGEALTGQRSEAALHGTRR
jgi:hypothetical protein